MLKTVPFALLLFAGTALAAPPTQEQIQKMDSDIQRQTEQALRHPPPPPRAQDDVAAHKQRLENMRDSRPDNMK